MLCLSDDPRGFQFAYPPQEFAGRDAILLVRMGRGARLGDIIGRYAPYFGSIDAKADTVSIRRLGRVEIQLAVIRAHKLLSSRP